MYVLFAFFIPTVIGVKIIDYFNKGLSIKNTIYAYLILLLLSFVLNILILQQAFGLKENILSEINTSVLFVESAGISILLNVVLALIWLVIQKNTEFKIEVKNENKIKKTRKTVNKTAQKNKNK